MMEVVDIETALETYDNYRILEEELKEAKESLREIEKANKDIKYNLSILSALEFATKKNYGRYDDIILKFLNEHEEIEEYKDLQYYISTYLKDIDFLKNRNICLSSGQIVLLVKDDNKYLVDLKYLTMQDVTGYNPKFIEFVIEMLKTQGYFIDCINQSDLPLLMNIKEDLEMNYDLEEFDDEEKLFYDSSLPMHISLEYKNAKLADKKSYEKSEDFFTRNCPFILNSDEVQAKWRELDELEPNISKEEYLLRYYKLLLVFGNDVEKVYRDASEDEKKYLLDAYQFYSSDTLKLSSLSEERIHHFRTASPMVNIEILKRKVFNKK